LSKAFYKAFDLSLELCLANIEIILFESCYSWTSLANEKMSLHSPVMSLTKPTRALKIGPFLKLSLSLMFFKRRSTSTPVFTPMVNLLIYSYMFRFKGVSDSETYCSKRTPSKYSSKVYKKGVMFPFRKSLFNMHSNGLEKVFKGDFI